MNFEYTADQKLLLETVSNFVKKESPISRFRELKETELGYSKEMWRQMGQLGWLGVALPEKAGGFGGSFIEAAIILEQFGAALVPEPFVPSILLGGMAISELGTPAQCERWLAPVIEGTASLALAYAESQGRFDVATIQTEARKEGAGFQMSGHKQWVLNGHAADQLIVTAKVGGGISLFVIDRNTPGLTVTPVKLIDGQRGAMLKLDKVNVDADRLLGSEGSAGACLELLMDIGAAAACAEGAGLLRKTLDMTTDYLRTRVQFGVKIGTFQALQHRAVDMFVETELCKSMAILASIRVADADPVVRKSAISAAKAQLAASGKYVTQQSIQLHGGIGVTDEADIGLYFKRMYALGLLFGDETYHTQRFANLPSFSPTQVL